MTSLKEHKQFVLVETISQHRMRYLIEVPLGKEEWALDTVTMEKAEEFSQKHLGEVIVSSRVIPLEEAIQLHKQDNGFASWTAEERLNAALTRIEDYKDEL